MIKKTPAAFAISVVLLGGIIYGALTWYYSALLAIKEEQIKDKDNQLKGKDDQLRGKDDLVSEYRERLHLLPPAQPSYAQLSNRELQQKALTVVQQLRQSLDQYNKERERQSPPFASYPPNATEEEKRQISERAFQDSMRSSNRLLSDYYKRFQTDAILLRDELRSRLLTGGDQESQPSPDHLYESPTNPIGIEHIINDLERFAKNLPVRESNG